MAEIVHAKIDKTKNICKKIFVSLVCILNIVTAVVLVLALEAGSRLDEHVWDHSWHVSVSPLVTL